MGQAEPIEEVIARCRGHPGAAVGAAFQVAHDLLGGTVIIEYIFTLPGLGASVLESVALRDYPQFQADVLIFAIMLMLVNLAVDLAYSRLDPRIRYE